MLIQKFSKISIQSLNIAVLISYAPPNHHRRRRWQFWLKYQHLRFLFAHFYYYDKLDPLILELYGEIQRQNLWCILLARCPRKFSLFAESWQHVTAHWNGSWHRVGWVKNNAPCAKGNAAAGAQSFILVGSDFNTHMKYVPILIQRVQHCALLST